MPATPQPGAKRFLSFLVLIIVCLLGYLFLDRVENMQKAVEQTAIEKKLYELNSMLTLVMLDKFAKGTINELQTLDGSNPFTILGSNYQSSNYKGEIESADLEFELEKGGWYYEIKTGEVIYYSSSQDGLFRFGLDFLYDDVDGSGVFEANRDRLSGLKMSKR